MGCSLYLQNLFDGLGGQETAYSEPFYFVIPIVFYIFVEEDDINKVANDNKRGTTRVIEGCF